MTFSTSRAQISIAMATYNGEKFIQEQLDSIAHQDLPPMELVITDDGSTDATLEIVDAFARSAPFAVRVFRNETRLGYADNFLKAASLCQGGLIAFCDQDDIWLGKKLKLCSQFFDDPAVMLAIHSARTITKSGAPIGYFPHFSKTKILDICDPFASGPGFATVIRRDLLSMIDNRLRPDRLRSNDIWCWFLAASAGKISIIADVLALYRQHESNVFGAPRARSAAETARSIYGTLQLTYEKAAESEMALSRILRTAASENSDWADRLKRSAKNLERRSGLHRMRSGIYRNDSTLVRRAIVFTRIFFSGGYWPDPSKTRLGPRAAMKDLLLGVPGLYRFFSRRVPPSKEI